MVVRAASPDPPGSEVRINRIRVSVLDAFRVEIDGRRVDLGRPQNELLLARLSLAAPDAVSVDSLIDALWEGRPPTSARKNLQKCVVELRRYLGRDAITTGRSGYAIAIPVENIDVREFERMLMEARTARRLRRFEEAWSLYEAAAALMTGRPLSGLPQLDFVADAAMRLDENRVSAVEEQMDVGLELGKHDRLISVLSELVRDHPLRERLWGQLMVALYRSGRQADALATFRKLRDTLSKELGIDPSPELRKLEEKILLQDESLDSRRPQILRNAPRTYTTFVGRDKELMMLKSVIEADRLITLVGPGGSGKTRLALQVAGEIVGSYPGGAWFADLASVIEPAEVDRSLGALFGLSEEPGTSPLDTLLGFLESAQLLLILDNCEHVAPRVAAVGAAILSSSSSVTLVATSREPLGLTGERLFPVDPMALPAEIETDPDTLQSFDSVRLFVERASAADPRFTLAPEVAPIVAEICRRLDGIPLAIELAARQLHALGPEELRQDLLNQIRRGAPGEPDERHRTMEAAIRWSFSRLNDEQQEVFLSLSAFTGSFSSEAAQQVLNFTEKSEVTRILSDLVARSMVVRRDETIARYRLLEPIRDFATREAAAKELTSSLRLAHAEWVLGFFTERSPIRGAHEREYIKQLSEEHHHLVAALDWAVAHDKKLALRLIVAGVPYTQMVVYRFGWTEAAKLAIPDDPTIDPRLRAAAMALGAEAMAEDFEHELAHDLASAALGLAEELAEDSIAATALESLGWNYRTLGRLSEAGDYLRAATERYEEAGDLVGLGRAHHALSFVLMAQGHYAATLETSMRSLEIWLQLGSDWGAGRAWWHIAAAHAREGHYDEAWDAVQRALRYFKGFDDLGSVMHVRAVEGDIARLSGNLEQAREIYMSCLQGFRDVGDRRCLASTFKNLGVVALGFGRDEEAIPLIHASLRRRYDLRDLAGVTECFESLGHLAERARRSDQAVTLLAAAERLREETKATIPPTEREEISLTLARLSSTLGKGRFTDLWVRAKEMPLERAMDEAWSLSPDN
jgi:predicted ATPase/DNA-binding SARP family transcriptional activator